MSAVKISTQKIAATLRSHLKGLGDVLSLMVAAEDRVAEATESLGHIRVQVGERLRFMSRDLLAIGMPADAVQAKLLSLIEAAAKRSYDWSTVEAWITASEVESTLPENLRGVFSSDALRTIRRVTVKAEEGETSPRETFATKLAADGVTTVAGVRAAYKEQHGGNGTTAERTPLDNAQRIAKGLDPSYVKSVLKSADGKAKNDVLPFVLFGAMIGAKTKDPEVVALVANTVLFPPKSRKSK